MPEIKLQYETGKKAPDGLYACMTCEGNDPEAITMPYDGDDTDTGKVLPECKKCGGYTYWQKVL